MSTMQMLMSLIISILSTLIIRPNLAQITPTSSNATSELYTFAVNSTTFQNGNITCNKSLCSIICDISMGCEGLSINANQSDILTLTCSHTDSCRNLIISASAQASTHIQCAAVSACSAAYFNINSRFVDISCSDPSATISSVASSAPCGYTSINTSKSSYVSVTCASDWSCYRLELHCPLKNGNCNVQCDASVTHSCRDIAIFTPNEKTIDLKCGTAANTCLDAKVFCVNTGLSANSRLIYDNTITEWKCASDDCCPFASIGSSNIATSQSLDIWIVVVIIAGVVGVLFVCCVSCRYRKTTETNLSFKTNMTGHSRITRTVSDVDTEMDKVNAIKMQKSNEDVYMYNDDGIKQEEEQQKAVIVAVSNDIDVPEVNKQDSEDMYTCNIKTYGITTDSGKTNMGNNYNTKMSTITEKKGENNENEEVLKLLPLNVNEWDFQHILKWIITINEGHFNKYENILFQTLSEQNVCGKDLQNLDKNDLLSFGIKIFGDRIQLFQQINNLINPQNDDEGKIL